MAKKYINWKTKGMNRDMSVSAFNPEFAFENLNLRLATNEGNTMMSWVSEKGTREMKLHVLNPNNGTYSNGIVGIPIGTAVLNHKLVLFTCTDNIYVFEKSTHPNFDLEGKLLYFGSLGFNPNYPLETLVSYESETVQKVYWTDGLNQPRVINIVGNIEKNNNTQFDFLPELQLEEEVSVTKMFGTGEFPPGVIQYAFTYYKKYGQESNIFYTTPLQYISYVDRGGAPDSKIANAFKISIANIDRHFDYLRIYSILRTSLNATPLCKRVADLPLAESIGNEISKAKRLMAASSSSSNFDDFGKTLTVSNFAKFSQITSLNNTFYVQGAACYGSYLFQAYIAGKYIDVIDLTTNERVATLQTDIDYDFEGYHGNVLSFGKVIPEGSDFPYLYYSCEAVSSPRILVIKIDNSNGAWSGKVVQQIFLPQSDGGASQSDATNYNAGFQHYYQNGCVDAENNCIWVSGYSMNSYYQNTDNYANNVLAYRKYSLPAVSDKYVYFSSKDVQASFRLPFKKGTQGMVIRKGKLYQCFGYDQNDVYDEFLDCIDLDGEKVVKSYNFPKEELKDLGEELESPYIYNDNLYLSATCYKWRYYTLWTLSFSGSGGGVVVEPTTPSEDIDADITFIDTGLQGDTIDPTELLYKGGEEVKAKTMEQKDGTLFLGNIVSTKPLLSNIKDTILEQNGVSASHPLAENNVNCYTIMRNYPITSKEPFKYINTLDSSQSNYMGAACFKSHEYYRLGVQFQYKTGKWSEPCWIGDCQAVGNPSGDEVNGQLSVLEFMYAMNKDLVNSLTDLGYKKARPLFAVPSLADRTVLCQGIGCPTMYRKITRYSDAKKNSSNSNWSGTQEGTLYAQSSWLFRTPYDLGNTSDYISGDAPNGGGYTVFEGKLNSHFDIQFFSTSKATATNESDYLKEMSPYLRNTEIMGKYDDGHAFYVDTMLATIHSPELQFDDSFSSIDFSSCGMNYVGSVELSKTYGDIDIQTSTPTIGSNAAGFIHRSIVTAPSAALISGLFYNDYIVEDKDNTPTYGAFRTSNPPVDFPVFMWHKNGSLNNDVARSNRSAELLKKKISNYRLGVSTKYVTSSSYDVDDIQFFHDDQLSMLKVAGHSYMGNIETMLTPSEASFFPIVGSPWRNSEDTDFESDSYNFIGQTDASNSDSPWGIWSWGRDNTRGWDFYRTGDNSADVGNEVRGLCLWREPVSMKYKSTPHLVVKLTQPTNSFGSLQPNSIFNGNQMAATDNNIPLVEITRKYNADTMYGGTSDEALQAATWIPCGPVVSLGPSESGTSLNYKWGDTYFQRFECLKTYPFTQEDKNQVVEIASFMVETRVNIDGRYDRNRAQVSNLNMTPQNFNLINPVYSQMDNFFSYKMLSEDDYENTSYPNTVTWTKTKQNGADVDLWTNVTLANVLEMDGNKGTVNKLSRLNNQLICFQDKGIAQILYNENTQISTTEGVPIEIANSEKVQGKRYYSDTVGCSNKWSVATTPSGIYFMDSNEKSIYLFNGQLSNLSTAGGFNSWTKQNIPSSEVEWNPNKFGNFVSYYDSLNQDVLFINADTALAFSEKFSCFTSFYDYEGASFFVNLDDMGIWVKDGKLWQHQTGSYCNFFDESKPFSMTLIANQEPQMDKIFTNLEFRACVEGEGTYDATKDKFTPSLPFDSLEAWNEYQHGVMTLSNRNAKDRFTHGTDNGILARKFRMWACDIPRDNAQVDASTEAPMGIKRFKRSKARPLDRIRNPWAYIKLTKNATGISKTEIHDIMLTYFG